MILQPTGQIKEHGLQDNVVLLSVGYPGDDTFNLIFTSKPELIPSCRLLILDIEHLILEDRMSKYTLYILDSIISLASMASNVYVQDLSDSPEEMKATISTGVSVNHLITVLIALFGGWIWKTLGIETLFVLSAILGLCNSAYAATIKTTDKEIA